MTIITASGMWNIFLLALLEQEREITCEISQEFGLDVEAVKRQ